MFIDMPLEELVDYRGTNPRPDDFDDYWDSALAELDDVDPDVGLVPADFTTSFADCFDMWFTGVRDAPIHAKLLRPKHQEEPGPALLMFHGYSMNAGDWSHKLGYVAQGFTVAALDCRGQGGLSQDPGGHMGTTLQGHIVRGLDGPPEDMMFRQIFLDTAQLARIVMDMPNVDAGRVGAAGGSQGGALTLACAALEPRIKRAVPLFPFLSDYLRVWKMGYAVDAYVELTNYFRRHDPRHERAEETFLRLGYIDVQHLAPRIEAEVLMGIGLMDEICPPSSQFAAYNAITSPKSHLIYPDFKHESLPGFDDEAFMFLAEM